VRRFLNFDSKDDDVTTSVNEEEEEEKADGGEPLVVPATPPSVAVAPAAPTPAQASPAASSITGPPSPSRADVCAQPGTGSAVPSHPLNVDDDEDEDGGEAAHESAQPAPQPALIPARAATAGSDGLPTLHAAASVDLGPRAGPKRPASPARESAKSTAEPAGLWSRVFGGDKVTPPQPAGGPVDALAPAAAAKPAAFEAAASATGPLYDGATGPVTHLTASGPAGSVAAVEAPTRKGFFGW
jgi:hypothetical protein